MSMVNILNNAIQGISRKSMKIRLISDIFTVNTDDIKREILKLIKTLKNNTLNFMIIGKFCIDAKDKMDFDGMRDYLLIKTKVEDQNEEEKTFQFVLSNKGCKISGYQEKWLMECSRCKQHPQ